MQHKNNMVGEERAKRKVVLWETRKGNTCYCETYPEHNLCFFHFFPSPSTPLRRDSLLFFLESFEKAKKFCGERGYILGSYAKGRIDQKKTTRLLKFLSNCEELEEHGDVQFYIYRGEY